MSDRDNKMSSDLLVDPGLDGIRELYIEYVDALCERLVVILKTPS